MARGRIPVRRKGVPKAVRPSGSIVALNARAGLWVAIPARMAAEIAAVMVLEAPVEMAAVILATAVVANLSSSGAPTKPGLENTRGF